MSVAPDGCGPGPSPIFSREDRPLAECILGFWLGLPAPCGSVQCDSAANPECAASDCQVRFFRGFYVDERLASGGFTASGALATSSSIGAASWSRYTLADWPNCYDDHLSNATQRERLAPVGAMHSTLCAAMKGTGQWTSAPYSGP